MIDNIIKMWTKKNREEPIKCVTAYRGEKSKSVRERATETRTTKNATGKIEFINELNEENQWECIVHTYTCMAIR